MQNRKTALHAIALRGLLFHRRSVLLTGHTGLLYLDKLTKATEIRRVGDRPQCDFSSLHKYFKL